MSADNVAKIGRAQARQLQLQKRYAAAQASRLNETWLSGLDVSHNQAIIQHLRSLREQSRASYRDNDVAKRYIQLLKTHIVGERGIVLQSKCTDPDGTLDNLANDSIENGWKEWGRLGSPEMTGSLSWLDIQLIVLQTVAVDGECFVMHLVDPTAPFGYRLHVLDTELVDIDFKDEAPNGNRIRASVELDQWGRAVAYWVRGFKDQSLDTVTRLNQERVRIPAEDMLHVFVHEFPGQIRGVPFAHSALGRMKQLEGALDAMLVRCRVGASACGFYTSNSGDEYIGDDQDDLGMIDEVSPGSFQELPAGIQIASYDPKFPDADFDAYVKSTMRGIAAGLGVSYASLTGDLSEVNFSSMRYGAAEDREVFKTLQNWFRDSFVVPVFERWLRSALLVQSLRVVGKPLDPLREEKYRRGATWVPRRWGYISPKEEAAANNQALQDRLKSRSQIMREQGLDPETVFKEIADERELMESLGLVAAPQPEPQQGPEDDDED